MYNHEWHFFDLNGKKTVITIIDAEIYNVSDGKRHNGKNYRIVGKITGTKGKKVAILLAIEILQF
ncbi:TPA: hypothetical protein MAG25_006026 [Klebsiella quasipneumoniae subsp. quasipneumoniae]|uniref:hypothetical protein n=1 Tax=Klebsiella TaxID=570 RepID=UPI0007D6EC3A|nr:MULTISPECIES: hypothetical protein [Klebsiella]HBS3705954.1 hypothetical protein [Klebsiella quasipneumoniae subsp. quasipneumoniae]HCA9669369.1 hypothetical protein [Klebsiella variicola subsp. variicola]MDX6872539.1 hypothetical protein [Klebsiella pneumoniae]HBR3022736.1 hypothetical protein [Klebsiella pneumoniae]HBV1006693.1 hypothetical protein [Klebsiella pneumoniae]